MSQVRRRFLGIALLIVSGGAYAEAELVGVGMTAEVKGVLLPGPELRVKPDPSGRSLVVVRLTGVYPHGTAGFRYDFSWFAYEAGKHDLTKYLERVDGAGPGELPPVEVEAIAALPPGPPGHLPEFSAPAPKLGGYRTALIAGSILWAAGFIALLCWRRRKPLLHSGATESDLPLADRLRPLLEQARAGSLDAEGRARLERLVLGFWRERLELTSLPLPLAVRQLREHVEAGALLRKVEEWLHSGKPSAGEAAVAELLTPYLSTPAAADSSRSLL
jgi:hypothetical protein